MSNYRFKYILLMKDGAQVEQESNEYFCSGWLAQKIIDPPFPYAISREDIKSLTRIELTTGETHVYGEESEYELFKRIIEDTEEELDEQLNFIKQSIDLF